MMLEFFSMSGLPRAKRNNVVATVSHAVIPIVSMRTKTVVHMVEIEVDHRRTCVSV